jgi:hypothetical protein
VKRRLSVVLALAMVFSLVLSSVAMAAPEGNKISNELELTVTVQDIKGATIGVNPDLALTSAVGLYDCFTVSTTPGDHEGKMVKVKLQATPATGFELEYVEQDPNNDKYRQYLPLSVDENGVAWFGPSTGFPLSAVDDSMFRVTWLEKGNYEFKLSIMGGEDFQEELASETVTVNVIDGDPMALTHATAGAGEVASAKTPEELMAAIRGLSFTENSLSINVTEGEEAKFDYVIAADLANNVSHVDNVLFVFEVAKDGGGITTGDFEITAISLRDDTEGINETFVVEEGKLKGFWGPPKGLLFAGQAATAFTVKFNAEGTYTVNTYTIQVAPAAEADL